MLTPDAALSNQNRLEERLNEIARQDTSERPARPAPAARRTSTPVRKKEMCEDPKKWNSQEKILLLLQAEKEEEGNSLHVQKDEGETGNVFGNHSFTALCL